MEICGMIPFIRSLSELMAITESRDFCKENKDTHISTVDSGQRKRYIRSLERNEIELPVLPKKIRRKWINNKKAIEKFLDTLDYNNQIQSSYDLTLLNRQSQHHKKDAA